MNDADVSKQIQQMVRFIRQEAEEKANEISVSAEEIPRKDQHRRRIYPLSSRRYSLVYLLHLLLSIKEIVRLNLEFNIEKLQLVKAEKRKIRQEYERKEKQVEVRRKIEYSIQLNASRIKVLQAQDDLVNAMKESASKELLRVSENSKAYQKLLKDLIVQSLLRLKEPSVLLHCREMDHQLIESILDAAKQEYAEKAKVHAPKIIIDECVYLPPPPAGDGAHGPSCSGGVVLASQDGKIVCENTLDARLEVVFRKKLPEIRMLLFGKMDG